VRSLINLPNLKQLKLDKRNVCIRSAHWKEAGLDVPPDEIIRQDDWIAVLKFLRAGRTEPVHELRLMFIGDGEVGKTSLVEAFRSDDLKANRIPKERRTVGIDIDFKRPLQFPPVGAGPAITCQVCDFAGQEIYYLSHTLHFTRRCLYVLMWTTHKFSDDDAAKLLDIADIVGPLKRWLQLLAINVPDANVLVVGTHCNVDPTAFEKMRGEIDKQVNEEIDRLCDISSRQATATRDVFDLQQNTVDKLLEHIRRQVASMQLMIEVPRPNAADIQVFVRQLSDMKFKSKSSLCQHAALLLQSVKMLENTRLRLGRLFGVHDGSIPSASAAAACLKLVNRRSFAVDSVDGVGVAELLNAIEATCRDREALPFMGEKIPVSWLQVSAALQQQRVIDALGNSVLPLADAAAKLGQCLRSELPDDGLVLAQRLEIAGLHDCLEFWSVLGRVFAHENHFLRDPCLIIELLKPLVHHNVKNRQYRKDFCTSESMHLRIVDELLDNLQQRAVLDHRLLSHFKAWPQSSTAIRSILSFFKQCFMISSLSHESTDDSSFSLVTARLCDPSNVERQRGVSEKAASIEATSDFFAVYALPSEHIGIIARMQATIEKLRPSEIHLDVAFGTDCICVKRGSFQHVSRCIPSAPSLPVTLPHEPHSCCVSVRRSDHVFSNSKLGSFCERVDRDAFSHALVVCSNDDGLFAFAARCVDEIIRSCSFGALFQSWLPCRPPHAVAEGASWVPAAKDWAQMSSALNPTSLSEVLSANASAVVFESHRSQLKDVLPRKSPIFMSHAFKGDGTGEFCMRLKKRIEDKLLCTVWLDKNEMGSADFFIKEMQTGMLNAHYFVICLTPLYLTRPHCLRELRWALDMCAAKQSTKKLLVLPLHPAVSKKGCSRIIDAAGCPAHVFLPVNDQVKPDVNRLDDWIGHKLSQEAILLLKRLTGQDAVGIQADWLKLQPWLSDDSAREWEEESLVWAEEDAVTLDSLLKRYLSDMLNCLAKLPSSSDFCFANFANDELASDPPSQDILARSDASVILDCYQRSRTLFSDQELVSLLRLGLSDVDIMACVEHGFKKLSVVEMQTSEDDVVCIDNPLDTAFRLAACMSGVNFDAARKSWLAYNQLYVGSGRRDPLLQKDPEHQNYCKAARMLEKVTAGIIPRIEEEFKGLHTVCLREVMLQKPADMDGQSWQQSSVALQAWKTTLLLHHRDSEICKAASMLERVESGHTPQHKNDPNSLYAKLLPRVMSQKPTDVDEDAWKLSSEKLLQAWNQVLLEILSCDELTKDVDVKHFFRNIPDHHANKLWSIEHGPHQIAKTFCDKGAGEVKRICELDSAKIFNMLQFCKQFPDKFKPAAKAANRSRNIMAHLEKNSPKMSNEQYGFIFDSMKKLLQCLDDPSKSLFLKEIQDLDAKELQMVDVASVNIMQKEIEFLRCHVAYLSSAGQANRFSLHLRAEHSLQVFPSITRARSFTCKVRIADAHAAVGDYVAGAAVDAGTCLVRASDSLDGYISKISLVDGIGAGDFNATHTSALIGQDVLIDVEILKMHAFSFPTLERQDQRQAELIATLKTFKEADGCDAGFKKIAGEVIGKLQKGSNLSVAEQRFWDAFCRGPDEAFKHVSPSSTPTAAAARHGVSALSAAAPASSRARGGSSDVAHSSDDKTPGSDISAASPVHSASHTPGCSPLSPAASISGAAKPTPFPPADPAGKPVAHAEAVATRPLAADPTAHADDLQVLFEQLRIADKSPEGKQQWITAHSAELKALVPDKQQRTRLNEFARGPSVAKAKKDKDKKHDGAAAGDQPVEPACIASPERILAAAAVLESSAAAAVPAPATAPASLTHAITPSSPVTSSGGAAAAAPGPASAPSIEAVVRGIGPAYEVYVQRFQDNGLRSLEDLSDISVEALCDELIEMGITAIKLHANRMARELVKARPS
jgi:GTPase SAR1 family protein